jgi:hypothetical protein
MEFLTAEGVRLAKQSCSREIIAVLITVLKAIRVTDGGETKTWSIPEAVFYFGGKSLPP